MREREMRLISYLITRIQLRSSHFHMDCDILNGDLKIMIDKTLLGGYNIKVPARVLEW